MQYAADSTLRLSCADTIYRVPTNHPKKAAASIPPIDDKCCVSRYNEHGSSIVLLREKQMALDVFISYSHKDRTLRDELETHLSNLHRQGQISAWYDGDIAPGADWKAAILTHLNKAHLILLLISADFMASEFCYSIEMQQAIARHQANQARVIPIILRPTDWEGAPFADLKALPTDGKPVTSWPSHDDAFKDVVKGLRAAIKELSPTNP